MGNSQTTELGAIAKAEQKIRECQDEGRVYLNLKGLELTSEDLVQLLPMIQKKLPDIISLCLANNNITILPESIIKLRNLEILILRNNSIRSLPENIGNLSKLEILVLENNNLESLPESFKNLYNLKSLILNNNNLESIPNIKRHPKLHELSLKGNNIATLHDDKKDLAKFTNLPSKKLEPISESNHKMSGLGSESENNNNKKPAGKYRKIKPTH